MFPVLNSAFIFQGRAAPVDTYYRTLSTSLQLGDESGVQPPETPLCGAPGGSALGRLGHLWAKGRRTGSTCPALPLQMEPGMRRRQGVERSWQWGLSRHKTSWAPQSQALRATASDQPLQHPPILQSPPHLPAMFPSFSRMSYLLSIKCLHAVKHHGLSCDFKEILGKHCTVA